TPDRLPHLLPDVLQFPGGHASVDTARFNLSTSKNHCSRGNHRVLADLGVIHDYGAHTNQDVVAHRAAMNNCAMGNGDIVSDHDPGLLVGAVNNRPVLDVRVIANRYGVHITPNHCVVPNSTVVAHNHLA